MTKQYARAALLALVLASPIAFSAIDFSGTWTLDPARSDLGAGAAAAKAPMQKVTLVIKQSGNTLAIERKAGERTETATYKLDGSTSVNKAPSGADIKSNTTWVGNTLASKSSMAMEGGMTVQMSDVRSLTDGGKTMVVELTRQTPRGEVKQRLVYDRQ
jgi:hypothetical protein